MSVFDKAEFDDHQSVTFGFDRDAGLKSIIAIHDTTLGPALGGCRMWPYESDGAALADVLKLSRAMTYKHALAGTRQGGGKAVILADPHRDKTPALLRAFGRLVDSLGGRYITAEDVGTSAEDMAEVAQATRFVAGLAETSGDPSPVTAYGVFCGIRAAVRHRLGRDDLKGLRVAVQGLGHVGFALCRLLHEAGARLVVADIDPDAVARAADAFGAETMDADAIVAAEADVFAPCALGGVLNAETIPLLRAPIVAGAANNQLADDAAGRLIAARGVLYAPDYAINAGGVINISFEGAHYDRARALARTERIYDTLLEIFRRAEAEGRPTSEIADAMARERIRAAQAGKGAH